MRTTTVQSQQWSGTSLQRKLVAAIFGGKLFGGSVFAGQCGPGDVGPVTYRYGVSRKRNDGMVSSRPWKYWYGTPHSPIPSHFQPWNWTCSVTRYCQTQQLTGRFTLGACRMQNLMLCYYYSDVNRTSVVNSEQRQHVWWWNQSNILCRKCRQHKRTEQTTNHTIHNRTNSMLTVRCDMQMFHIW